MHVSPILPSTFLAFVVLAGAATGQDRSAPSSGIAPEERMTLPPASVSVPEGCCAAPLDLSFGKPAVEVLLDGRGPFTLLVDTGASPVLILDEDLAAELDLPHAGSGRLGDPTDPEALEVALRPVESLSIGGATFSELTAVSWDRSGLYAGRAERPRGVVGFPLFAEVLVTFDYPRLELRIATGRLDEGEHVVSYSAPLGVPEIPIHIDGRRYEAHLDSGSMGALMLPLSMRDAVEVATPLQEVGRARTVNSEFAIYSASFAGRAAIAGHPVDVETLSFVEILDQPNVGSGVLRNFAITFDQRSALARFDAAEGPAAPVEARRGSLGLRLGRIGSSYVVAGTEPDSPAATADLREGDRLVAVNGKEVADLAQAEFAEEMRRPVVALILDRDGERLEVSLQRP